MGRFGHVSLSCKEPILESHHRSLTCVWDNKLQVNYAAYKVRQSAGFTISVHLICSILSKIEKLNSLIILNRRIGTRVKLKLFWNTEIYFYFLIILIRVKFNLSSSGTKQRRLRYYCGNQFWKLPSHGFHILSIFRKSGECGLLLLFLNAEFSDAMGWAWSKGFHDGKKYIAVDICNEDWRQLSLCSETESPRLSSGKLQASSEHARAVFGSDLQKWTVNMLRLSQLLFSCNVYELIGYYRSSSI